MVAEPSGFPLDTSVVSELMRPRPNHRVTAWVVATTEVLLHLGVITIGEIRKGIEPLGANPRRVALHSRLDRDVRMRFAALLLTFDDAVAERWGQLEPPAKRKRVTLPTIDAQLAATALHHGLPFVTRNTADIGAHRGAGLQLLERLRVKTLPLTLSFAGGHASDRRGSRHCSP